MSAYYEFASLLLISAVVGAVAIRLRQPLIVAFILVGILVGPAGMGLVAAHDEIHLLAEMGITVLLFVVGLKLDLHLVKHLGPVALATGLGQLTFTIVFGYLLCLALGLSPISALYVAIALTFSSTIIIVKLLSDKGEIDSLHGRIAMGFLIVQDIAVVVAMMLLGSYQTGMEALGGVFLLIAFKIVVALVGIGLLMRYVFPRLLHLLARSQELLLLFAVAWGTSLAALGDVFGFSKEVGAFLAGFSLASTGYREAISARLASLRDFLLLFFFLDLGTKLDLTTLGAEVPAATLLSLFVLIGNPLIVMAIMGYMGYRRRTGFLAGLTVAQISEFSIIFIALGITLGHIGTEALGLVTLVGLVTITLSTYMILYSGTLYRHLGPWLRFFERKTPYRELSAEQAQQMPVGTDVIVFGMGRYGRRVAEDLQARGLKVMGVDFDPEVVRRCRNEGLTVYFGDAEDPGLEDHLPLQQARCVITALPRIPESDINLILLKMLHRHGFRGAIIMAAPSQGDVKRLLDAGATRVLLPFSDAAAHAAKVVVEDFFQLRETPKQD